MEVISLDHERFEGAKELAAISTKIAEGRALIAALKTEKDFFLQERDDEMRERIELVLAESEDLIRKIGENHDDLVAYRRMVDAYIGDIRAFHDRVVAFSASSEEYFKEATKKLDAVLEAIREERKKNTQEKSLLDGAREGIEQERRELAERTRKVKDDEGRLARAWKELETKTKKNA